ncbi:MAG: hypothetical protein WBM14_09165 [Terracidiphilus sp.]
MRIRRTLSLTRLCLLAAALLSLALPLAAQSTTVDTAKMVSLMQACSYDFHTTSSPTVWTIHFTGTHLKDIKVVLALGGDADSNLVIFVTVVEKRRMPVTTDFMRHLLEQNHALDQVKIGFDADGDLSVRTDASLRVADAEYLRNVVSQVKNSSDDLYGQIEPNLLP